MLIKNSIFTILIVVVLVLGTHNALAYQLENKTEYLYTLINKKISEKSTVEFISMIEEFKNLNNPLDDEQLALILLLQYEAYFYTEQFDKAESYWESAVKLVDTINSTKLTIERDHLIVFRLRYENKSKEALLIADRILVNPPDYWPHHKIYNFILEVAYINTFVNRYDRSLVLLKQALAYVDKVDDIYIIAENYNLLGMVYEDILDYENSALFYQKAIDLSDGHEVLDNNSLLYSHLAESYRQSEQYEKAEENILKAISKAKKHNNEEAIAYAYATYSRILQAHKKYHEALDYLIQSYNISKDTEEYWRLNEIHLDLARLYIQINDLNKAKIELEKAQSYSDPNDSVGIITGEEIKSQLYELEGDFKNAYFSLKTSNEKYKADFNKRLRNLSTIARKELEQEKLFYENELLQKSNDFNEKNLASAKKMNLLLVSFLVVFAILFLALSFTLKKVRRIAEENRKLSLTDRLSDLPNRRSISLIAESCFDTSKKATLTMSLIIFDIDNFKSINDSYGHLVGDQVIAEVKLIVSKLLRSGDTIGRFGGEEFLIILPDTSIDAAETIAERIRKGFEAYDYSRINSELTVTCSFGVATNLSTDKNLDTVIKRADRLLYKAKQSGRNKVFTS